MIDNIKYFPILIISVLLCVAACDERAEQVNCKGDVTPCIEIEEMCEAQQDCQANEGCDGLGECSGGLNEWECQMELECEWVVYCTGDATPCDEIENETQCGLQKGCVWEESQ